MSTRVAVAVYALLLICSPADAFHRQTPPVVALTQSGDVSLPRLAAGGRRLAIALDVDGHQIFRQARRPIDLQQITTTGDNRNPAISDSGAVVAWDSDCELLGCAEPGRQIFLWTRGETLQATNDPTGTSVNPALNGKGTLLAFESQGDLAGSGNAGVRQIFLRTNHGAITQASQGLGDSRNPALSRNGRSLVYESTNDSAGSDGGVPQIWLAAGGTAAPLTDGQGASRLPAIDPDARVVAFESTAALVTDGHDTGVSQIFTYDARDGGLCQLTNDPRGCSGTSVQKVYFGDWRIGFVCHGEGFFQYHLSGERFRLPTSGGDTSQVVAELGSFFFVVNTTANMLGGGPTPGHRVYMINFFLFSPPTLGTPPTTCR